MNRRVLIWGGGGVLLAGLVSLAVWMRSEERDTVPTEPLLPIVRLVELRSGDAVESRSFPAIVKETATARLAFRVPGPLCELNATIGERVTAGSALARLDPRDFELAVRRGEAGLAEAEAGLRAMRTGARVEDVASLEAKVYAADSQLETARLQWERMERLFHESTAAKVQYDLAKTQYDQATAQSEASHQELSKAKTGARPEEIESMEAKIAGIQVQLETARNALADSVLIAPLDGVVTQKYVENHEMINAGTPVLALADTSIPELSCSVPEEIVRRQAELRRFTCVLEAYPGVSLPATLKELGQSLPPGQQAYPLVVRLSPPDDVEGIELRPGMAATLRVELTQSAATCLVPLGAIVTKKGVADNESESDTENGDSKNGAAANSDSKDVTLAPAAVCIVDETNTVRHRPVRIRRILDSVVEIETELTPGTRIVGAGARYLSEGQKVEVAS